MQDLINEAAEMIRPYNAKLADMFLAQPFQRVNLADAFEAGFKSGPSEYTRMISNIADLDRRMRMAAA